MSDCIFCKIIVGDIPSERVYEDEDVIAFKDIKPDAPVHYLVIPREHISTANDASESNQAVFGHLFVVAARLAKKERFADDGYRCIMNCNNHGGQEVFHVHMHLLAGKKMAWNPA